MKKVGLERFVRQLEDQREIEYIDAAVSPDLEITEVTDRISKDPGGGKALLFTNTGTSFSVLINAFGSTTRMNLVFGGQNPAEMSKEIKHLTAVMTQSGGGWMRKVSRIPELKKLASILPRRIGGKGRCQEVVMDEPDLNQFPILTCWPADGGRFITLPLVHTIDPDTGGRNVGMYRMQVFDKQTTGMHWHMHKTGARHYRRYRELKKKMPVVVVLGGDPVYTYCATAPLPDGIDEYMLAGFIRKKKVRLVKCISQELWVPADADVVIEGYVDPMEELTTEGPFGDHTGFYSLADAYPKFHITAITHAKRAIYPATIVGIPPQEDAWIAEATESLFVEPIKLALIPELLDMHLPASGVAHNLAIFSIDAVYPGQGAKTVNTAWGAGQMMFTKYATVVGSDIPLKNYMELARLISKRVDPAKHILRSQGPLDILDHAADELAFGGKLGVDATGPEREDGCLDAESFMQAMQIMISANPAIQDVRSDLLDQGISMVCCFVNKDSATMPAFLMQEIANSDVLSKVKCWLLVDADLLDFDWYYLFWILGSHSDPGRDVLIHSFDDTNRHGIMLIDATRKSVKVDGFQRDWPNPVIMSEEVIDLVDRKWNEFALGPARSSPSRRFSLLASGVGAVAE